MNRRAPLPENLRGAPFRVSTALDAGVAAKRLRAADLDQPFHGVRRQRLSAASTFDDCISYSVRMHALAAFGSVTAAQLYGMPLPRAFESVLPLHIVVPPGARAPRGAGVLGRTMRLADHDVRLWRGLRVTTPARTWCDLAAALTVDDLVAAGDYVIHWRQPLASHAELADAVDQHVGRRGRGRIVEALNLLDDRAESPRESLVRLLLVRAGITGWVSNAVIRLPGVRATYRGDFVFPDARVIVEYQGGYHDDPQQRAADMTRMSRLTAHKWTVIEVGAADLDQGTLQL